MGITYVNTLHLLGLWTLSMATIPTIETLHALQLGTLGP